MDDVILSAFEYTMILAVPITTLTIIMFADEMIQVIRRAVAGRRRRIWTE